MVSFASSRLRVRIFIYDSIRIFTKLPSYVNCLSLVVFGCLFTRKIESRHKFMQKDAVA